MMVALVAVVLLCQSRFVVGRVSELGMRTFVNALLAIGLAGVSPGILVVELAE